MRQFTGFLLLAVCTLLLPLSVTGTPHAGVTNDVQRRYTPAGRSAPAAGKVLHLPRGRAKNVQQRDTQPGRDVLTLRQADPSPMPSPVPSSKPLCPPGESPCFGSGIWWDVAYDCIPTGKTCCPSLSIPSKFWFPLPLTFCRSRCLLPP